MCKVCTLIEIYIQTPKIRTHLLYNRDASFSDLNASQNYWITHAIICME